MDPAGGSTASTVLAASAATTSILTGGRHPRRAATRPAATPPAPASAAAHNATLTSHAVGCRGIHHGGPRPDRGRLTTALLGPATETAIMISSEDPMQASATRPRRLARACARRAARCRWARCRWAGRQRAALRLPGAPGAGPWPLAR